MKLILWLLRIIVGILFIFSGLIKANDPLGLSYKMNEFFEVWNMVALIPFSLTLSVLMIGFEIISGIALLIGAAPRIFTFLLLLLNLFFTFLTAYVYLTDKIKECGCFGDCIKISNAETFWKDVILTIFVIIIFINRHKIKPLFNSKLTTIIMSLVVILAFSSQWYTLRYLPVYDCLPYKSGNNIWEKMQAPPGSTPDVYKTVLIYEKDGKKEEFTEDNFPWEDSTWVFVDSKSTLVQKGNSDPLIKDFVLNDYYGNDLTESILKVPGETLFFFIRDVKNANTKNIERIQKLIKDANQNNIPFYILSSSSQPDANSFSEKYGLKGAQWLIIDGTVSKTAMRTNPGLMLLKNGSIAHKWSYMSYPKQMTVNDNEVSLQ